MRSKQEVLDELRPILREVLDVPDLVVDENLSAKTVPEWDSLNHMRILSAAEHKFSVLLTGAEIEKVQNVGDFAALISSKLA